MRALLTTIAIIAATTTFAQQGRVRVNSNNATQTQQSDSTDPEEVADLNNSLIDGRKMLNGVSLHLRSDVTVVFEMELEVDDAGNVVDIDAYKQSGDERLNEMVLRSVKHQVKFSKLNVGYNTLHKYIVVIQ